MKIEFRVYDTPAPGGSKKAFPYRGKDGKLHAIVTDDAKRNKPWREAVKAAALDEYIGILREGPLRLTISFLMPRPKSHFRSGKNAHLLKENAPQFPTAKPDVLKLARSTEDALTGILWRDDCQNVKMVLEKLYAPNGERPGARIIVETL